MHAVLQAATSLVSPACLPSHDPPICPACPPLVQSLGIMAEVEGAGFARRVPAVLPLLGDLLASRAETDAAAAEAAADAAPGEGDDLLSAAPGWQEAYYCLLLLQRLLECAAAQLAWATGAPAQRCWSGAQALLLHRHQWVRKASGRLVGAGLAAPGVGAPWLEASGAGAAGGCTNSQGPGVCVLWRQAAGGWHLLIGGGAATGAPCRKRKECACFPPRPHPTLLPRRRPSLSPPRCRRAGPLLLPPAGLGSSR